MWAMMAGMTIDVVTEIVIARRCEQVAAYAGDPSNASEWYANIISVRWQTPPPVGVGSRMDFVARSAPVMVAAIRCVNAKDLARLKRVLESS
jgi:hypothetical protein